MKPLTEQEAIATILVNQRIMRNGAPPIVNALDLLPQKLRDDVMDDAQAVIDGLQVSRIAVDIYADLLHSLEWILTDMLFAAPESFIERCYRWQESARIAVAKAKGEQP